MDKDNMEMYNDRQRFVDEKILDYIKNKNVISSRFITEDANRLNLSYDSDLTIQRANLSKQIDNYVVESQKAFYTSLN